jgi:transglutaminase-like putative cysteine protease
MLFTPDFLTMCKGPWYALCLVSCLLAGAGSMAQVTTDYTTSISSLKAKYPKTDVVAVDFKEEYRFGIAGTTAGSKVTVHSAVTQTLVPLKDFVSSNDAIFYNDESAVEGIHVTNSKNKNLRFGQQCRDYQSEGIFYSDAKVCTISIPLEEKGLPVTFTYDKKYKDIKYLTSVYFNEQLPIEEKTIVFYIPDWLEVDMREFNFKGYDIKKVVEKDAVNKVTKYMYKLQHIPAFEEEYHSPNWARSFPHVIVVSKSYTENGQKKVLFESVKDLYGWYHSLSKEVHNQPEELKPLVGQLTTDKKSDVEKVESIYYWVQDKIRYIAFENGIMGFKPDAAQNVLKNKYGDCKGKANLLKEMLKLAGYDARLTWIGTADLPYDYSLPSLAVDNHMICTVILDGKRYFLDGTEESIAFNDYAHRIQGKQVLIEDGDQYILDKVPEFQADRNKVDCIMKLKLEGENLTGVNTSTYNGEAKIGLVGSYQSIRSENQKDAFERYLRSGNANIVISNIKNPNWNDRQKPLQVSFDMKASHQITRAGNELYINLDWEKELATLEFDSTRKNDYELNHKLYITTQIEFTIPDGYKMDYVPDALTIKKPDYSFEGSYSNKGNMIVYSKKIIVNTAIIKKNDFAAWNEYIKAINKFYADQVVLVKK